MPFASGVVITGIAKRSTKALKATARVASCSAAAAAVAEEDQRALGAEQVVERRVARPARRTPLRHDAVVRRRGREAHGRLIGAALDVGRQAHVAGAGAARSSAERSADWNSTLKFSGLSITLV